jgi:hypothetical protein
MNTLLLSSISKHKNCIFIACEEGYKCSFYFFTVPNFYRFDKNEKKEVDF